ncbi:hypothetical protein B0H10DRAFT_1945545 [Mycena sp. CBHHK59/15]|nr:hypothetical protein B0H10DRAFT_1945545 [Mycena sp. CBHHK59/15]
MNIAFNTATPSTFIACFMARDSLTTQSLRRMLQTANAIKELCPIASSPIIANFLPPPQAPIVLPPAPSILPKLLDLGLDVPLAENLSRVYFLRTQDLRSLGQRTLRGVCDNLAIGPSYSIPLPDVLNRVIAAHTKNYMRTIRNLEERAIAVATNWKRRSQPPRKTNTCTTYTERKPFNHEFTPFLLKYFEYNSKPSRVDREEMAKKSMMDRRQIDVWFQNHRRRARLEGKVLKKLGPADAAPLELCLKSMEEKMVTFIIPEGLRQSVDEEASEPGSEEEEEEEEFYKEQPQEVDTSDVLNPPAPRHAFPTPFSRGRHMVSTITWTQEFSFLTPEWPRKASAASPAVRAVNIDDMVAAFAGMHVFMGPPVHSPFPNGQNAARSAITVIPSCAPHPALVRDKFVPAPVVAATGLNTVPAPRTRQHPFRSPSPSAQPATLVISTTRRKKAAGPPRRTPKHNRGYHRSASPGASEASSPARSCSPPSRLSSYSASSPPSRTPSFGSSGFSSSRSSSASSGPTTPVGSPSALPLDILDTANLDLFGEPLQQHVSPVEAFNGYPEWIAAKQRSYLAAFESMTYAGR